jgi:putative ABC transport system ATP-binding protein
MIDNNYNLASLPELPEEPTLVLDNLASLPSQAALVLDNVTKVFNPGTINEKVALSDLSLTINEGEFVTVIGGNGAGKSTMLNAIAGVFKPDAGKIIIDGVNVSKQSEYKRAKYLGRVFQDPLLGTASNMNIEENLAIAMRRGKMRGLKWGLTKKDRELFKQELAYFDLGLENRLSAKVGLLSGGQRQAITLIMATLKKPKLLLLDEHTAALDPKTAKKVLDLTDKIVGENHLTTLMITHNMSDAIKHGDRLIMMNEGQIVYDVKGEEKKNLTVKDLLEKFEKSSVELSDKMILS